MNPEPQAGTKDTLILKSKKKESSLSINIFAETVPPNDLLFFTRNKIDDVRLGESAKRDQEDYDNSNVVLLGIPQDEGVKRNKGRAGSKEAPDLIRTHFYKLVLTEKIEKNKFFDLGNLIVDGTLEEMHDRQEKVVTKILQDNKKVIVLGGGNDISYPDCKSIYNVERDMLAFNIDSHFDVRPDKPRNSGTPYYNLLEEGKINFSDFYEIGIKTFAASPNHTKYLKEKGGNIFDITETKEKGIDNLLAEILAKKNNKALFWGFDMDVVRASDAPGVSASYPTGLTAEDAILIAEIAGRENRTKIFEISEVNPLHDIDGRTCKLAAIMIWSFLNV
jgi:formiminoglutamase